MSDFCDSFNSYFHSNVGVWFAPKMFVETCKPTLFVLYTFCYHVVQNIGALWVRICRHIGRGDPGELSHFYILYHSAEMKGRIPKLNVVSKTLEGLLALYRPNGTVRPLAAVCPHEEYRKKWSNGATLLTAEESWGTIAGKLCHHRNTWVVQKLYFTFY